MKSYIDFKGAVQEDLLFQKERGYGFVEKSWFYPVREVDVSELTALDSGIYTTGKHFQPFYHNENDYNYGGMIFRYQAKAGVYRVRVKITEDSAPVLIGITGMNGAMLEKDFTWDPSGQISKKCSALWNDNIWSFDYVSGNGVLDVEIEPKSKDNTRIGIEYIEIEELAVDKTASEKPTIFVLGDSTAQSFIYEEAIMSGWGQLFDDFFDLDKVNLINYSMGGRSLKNMYQEGRFNDMMLSAKPGDCVLLQSGHNDESRDELKGMHTRFGRGNDEETFTRWLEEVYIPAAKALGICLIFVTSMTRIDSEKTEIEPVFGGFQHSENPHIHFPGIMEEIAGKHDIPVVDLYSRSVDYISQIGGEAAKGMFLGVEPGETPGKTNSGSFANGNPSGSCDGTHSKEALAKQWVRLILLEIVEKKLFPLQFLKEEVLKALQSGDERALYHEISLDVRIGENAYYRNSIERMIRMGALKQDEQGYFYPKKVITEREFQSAIECLWKITLDIDITDKALTREKMAFVILKAYELKFGKTAEGKWNRPVYMTDYNGVNVAPDSPYYDPNLDGESAQYYPLVTWQHIEDRDEISPEYAEVMKEVYELGLMRSECGIERGKMKNGTLMEPHKEVTREKAAKELFFLSVLPHDIKEENDKF